MLLVDAGSAFNTDSDLMEDARQFKQSTSDGLEEMKSHSSPVKMHSAQSKSSLANLWTLSSDSRTNSALDIPVKTKCYTLLSDKRKESLTMP